jgi:hypothetical protein
MWHEHLTRLLSQRGKSVGLKVRDFERVDTPRMGVSRADVQILSTKDGRLFALKVMPKRAPRGIELQLSRQNRLAELYGEHHVPEVIVHDPRAMLMAYAGESLSWVAERSMTTDALTARVRGIYGKVASVWDSHHESCSPSLLRSRRCRRKPEDRWKRIFETLLSYRHYTAGEFKLNRCQDKELVVNGVSMRASLRRFYDVARHAYARPRYLVQDHGDLHGENILVGTKNWLIIDPEWFGLHDWRVALTFMGYWWRANHLSVTSANIEERGNYLAINYAMLPTPAAVAVSAVAEEMAQNMGKNFGEANWSTQYRLQGAIMTLGQARFVQQSGRSPDYAVALLGHGIQQLKDAL